MYLFDRTLGLRSPLLLHWRVGCPSLGAMVGRLSLMAEKDRAHSCWTRSLGEDTTESARIQPCLQQSLTHSPLGRQEH